MDTLKAEIAAKRKELERINLWEGNRKYFKRACLARRSEDLSGQTLLGLGLCSGEITTGEKCITDNIIRVPDDENVLLRSEVIRRLRERSEPITLFGESEIEAFRRLRQCEISQPESNRGFRNDFQEALEQVDQAYLNEILSSVAPAVKSGKKSEEFMLNESVTYDSIQEMAKNIGKGGKDNDMQIITTLLQFILKLWHEQLTSYSDEKMSTKVKMARVIFTQTREYMKPLFRKLKHKTLPEDILDSLRDITKHLLNRNYIAASDAYLEMAIGNAPWPIGVTMVGIHARTGREKIFSKNVAHVMNDETQRKYIQGLKRLMTKCQEYFPTDPSRCVEYVSKKDM
uniref:Pre-mRNA-splicing factor 18 n=1 Tax=Tabanus bromius TaxID=304241 RepID=A0A0K8TS61_TABBR